MRNVLVVEDNSLVYPTIIEGLSFGGDLAVTHAIDAVAALAALGTTRPDLALIDVGLPGLSGIAVARHAVEMDVPTVLMSGRADLACRSMAYGFPVLTKPFRVHAFLMRFEEVMAEAMRLNRALLEQTQRGREAVARSQAVNKDMSETWLRICARLVC